MKCFKNFCCTKRCDYRQREEIRYIIGPAGPAGEAGRGLQIDGTVTSEQLLPKTPRNGTLFLVGMGTPRKMFVYDEVRGEWGDQGYLQGEKGEKGDKGDKGDSGDGKTKGVYLVTLRSPDFVIYNGGFEVPSRGRLPLLEEREFSVESPVELDKANSTIFFNEAGVYEVGFTFNGYTKIAQDEFDLNADFVAVGFRQVDSDNVLVGVNDWSFNEVPHNISGHGIVRINDISKSYELVNLHVRPLFLLAGRKEQTMTSSYMITPLVTMVIKQLQKI